MGLASLSRTVFLGISIGLGIILLLKKLLDASEDSGKQVNSALSFLAAVGLVVAPWILRNYIVFGMPVIGSSLTGYNVFRMNFIIAGENYFPHYVGPTEAYTAVMQLLRKSNLTGIENEAQMQSIYMKAGLQIIAQHPFQYLGLSLYRFIVLWFNTSVNEAYNMKYILSDYAAIVQQTLLLFGVMFSAARNLEKNWALIVSLLLGCGAYMAIDAQIRYLVDLMPAIVILSALSMANLGLLLTQRHNAIPQTGHRG